MALEYETGRQSPDTARGVRPHEFPSRSGGGTGTVIALGVIVLMIGIVVIGAAFTGPAGDPAAVGTETAPAIESAPSAAPATAPESGAAPTISE